MKKRVITRYIIIFEERGGLGEDFTAGLMDSYIEQQLQQISRMKGVRIIKSRYEKEDSYEER